MAFNRAMSVIAVRDVVAARDWYARIGFAPHGTWGEPPGFCIVQRGDVSIALERWTGEGPVPKKNGWAVYIYVDDADAFAAELEEAGVSRNGPIYDSPWGMRDSAVDDLDGHTIAFGHPMEPNPNGPGLSSDRGRG